MWSLSNNRNHLVGVSVSDSQLVGLLPFCNPLTSCFLFINFPEKKVNQVQTAEDKYYCPSSLKLNCLIYDMPSKNFKYYMLQLHCILIRELQPSLK